MNRAQFFIVLVFSVVVSFCLGFHVDHIKLASTNNRHIELRRHLDSRKLYQTTTDVDNSYSSYLPEKLKEIVVALRTVPDDRLRYQQLLFLASKCAPMPEALKVPENKVPGCLSTVFVHATLSTEGKVTYLGDSDAQLTKGLMAILVDGLSGATVEEIDQVKPDFIQFAGIGTSLTPGRNNGFLNMLQLMKVKAKQLKSSDLPLTAPMSGSIYQSMLKKLSMLQPDELVIEDESYKHAGHAGMNGVSSSGETHFNVRIIAKCFQGLSLVQRHKMVYTLLAQEMIRKEGFGIHALSIYAKTPDEESAKN